MKVLITEGAGFVGRRFTKRLPEEGNRVAIIDSLVGGIDPTKHVWFLGNPPKYENFKGFHEDCRELFKKDQSD
jgi:nucleoside-diphosphate-sugar epimerase